MYLYTIGFTQKSARQFFERIKYHHVQVLVDIRLKNTSALSVFTMKRDLPYFLEEICSCKYEHCPNYAPTQELLSAWREQRITWPEYEHYYRALMNERDSVNNFIVSHEGLHESVCLLCAEPTPEYCHRRLFAEMIHEQRPEFEIIHL